MHATHVTRPLTQLAGRLGRPCKLEAGKDIVPKEFKLIHLDSDWQRGVLKIRATKVSARSVTLSSEMQEMLVQVDASWNLLPWVELDSKCKGGRSSNPSQPIALSPTSSSHRHARPVSSTPKTHLKFHAASACRRPCHSWACDALICLGFLRS